jgi:hypothetical protein
MIDDILKLDLKCSIKIIIPSTMNEDDKPNEDNVGGNIKLETNPKTKIPALLNTSFNLHGEPIVNTINDALHVFEKSELDVLWLDNHIIEKKCN